MSNTDKIDLTKIITTENLANDPDFISWTVTLLKELQQMRIEGAITANDPLNKILNADDGVDIDYLLKSVQDGTEEGRKWLKQIADMTQMEIYSRQVM